MKGADLSGTRPTCRREATVGDLIKCHSTPNTGATIAGVATSGQPTISIDGLIARYRASRAVSGLMRQGSGQPQATEILGRTQDALILDIIEWDYLTPSRRPPQGGVRKI